MDIHKKFVPVGQSLHFGWHEFHRHTSFYILSALIYAGLFVIYSLLQVALKDYEVLMFLAVVIYTIAIWFFTIGYFKEVLSAIKGNTPNVKHLFSYNKAFLPFLATSIVTSLIALGGFILFIIPGIIWSLKYSLAPYIAIDKGYGVKASLRESAKLTKGLKWDLLGAYIPLAIVSYLGFFALLIGGVVSIQVAAVAMVFIYHSLDTQSNKPKVTKRKTTKRKVAVKKVKNA